MDIFKRFLSRFALYLTGVTFFLTAVAFAFFNTISAPNIKETLKEEDTYAKIVPAVLSTADYGEGASTGLQLPLEEPWVVASVQRAFPASDLEEKGTAVIDSTFNWLDGQTEEPDFRLDFTANKQRLTEEIGANAQSRLSGLPVCNLNNLPESVDAFRADCLPFGLNPQAVANEAATEVNNNDSFLSNPVITSDNLPRDSSGTKQEADFRQLDGFRSLYQNKGLIQWLLPILTILLAAGGILLASDRSKATQRLGRTFLTSGVGLVVMTLLVSFGFEQALKSVAKDAVSRELLVPVLISMTHQMRTIYLIFALIALVIAVGLFISRQKLLPTPSSSKISR